MAHRESSDDNIGAEYTSPSEAQAQAEDRSSQRLPVAILSLAEEVADGRGVESFLPVATGETDNDGGAVKDKGKGPGPCLNDPVVHEVVNSDPPNPAGMRPSRSSSPSSHRDNLFASTAGLLRQDIVQPSASADRNNDEVPGVLQNSPSDDLVIARSDRSVADDRPAEIRRSSSSSLPGAAVLFHDDQGSGGQAAEEFELALRQGAMSEGVGEQDGPEA
ncbi:uncharacterized protein PHACADRAFT_262671 [Phanerochaete carnosa HHB-10118-sp]|uniref:Uncharacterized protein n=1 Tax=Phanerochaete carnosa (strain HHB-10118-sp) TaxID=650164 RepID=K5VL61_PHACS|nr:uncharacterized protein PHACADRAFT_262671 [Phanerochaete carnosa HHB-10118-sp]EKM52163.1 hypothetical protein PHACADRAFT_262671 [Phanerochaete carnosa HHB-10118-sp]